MAAFKEGDVVLITQMCGHGIKLPVVGTVQVMTSEAPEWYTVHIIWIEHINEECTQCHKTTCKKVQQERDISVRSDWMRLVEPIEVENQ